MTAGLSALIGAGRRNNAGDQKMIQGMHDNAVSLGASCDMKASSPQILEDLLVEQLAMSHGDVAKLLRMALHAEYPAQNTHVWIKDVYDDSVVYEVSDGSGGETLYQRSFAVVDAKVTFGDAQEVIEVTNYVAVTASDREDSDDDDPDDEALRERAFARRSRNRMAAAGTAMPDGSFPIATTKDLKNAISSFGRAKDKTKAKAHIIKRAKALGATTQLPEGWMPVSASDREPLEGDLVPLIEKSVKSDGTIGIKVIAPGQGSSGYYSSDMLKRDGPAVFTSGLHMYLDHPSVTEESERPERSVRDLAGTFTSDARWEDDGPAGPGLYADAKIRSDIAPLIEQIAPNIGVSIRAMGTASYTDVDGKTVRNIDSIGEAKSVDFVTIPGAGGCVLDLIESARTHTTTPKGEEVTDVTVEELAEAKRQLEDANKTALEEAQGKIDALTAEHNRMREREMMREARDLVVSTLGRIGLPDVTRERLIGQLAANPPVKEDKSLDREALQTRVREAAKAELDYLVTVTGGNGVRGMGGEPITDEQVAADLVAAFKEAGYADDVAAQMAAR